MAGNNEKNKSHNEHTFVLLKKVMFMFLVCHSCQENIGTGFSSFSHFIRSLFLVLLLGFCINFNSLDFSMVLGARIGIVFTIFFLFVICSIEWIVLLGMKRDESWKRNNEWERKTMQPQTQEHKLKKLICTRSNRKHNTKSEILNKIRHSNGTEIMENVFYAEKIIGVGCWKAEELHG